MPGEPVTSSLSDQPFRIGEWQVEPLLDQVTRGAEVHRLEPRTMRVLVRLAQTPGKVVSSEELLDSAWSGVIVSPASVYQAISQLRKLLGDTDATPRYIVTVPRRGYRLVAAVAPPEPGAATPEAPVSPVDPPVAVPDEHLAPRRRLRGPLIAVAAALAIAAVAITLVRHEPRPAATLALPSQSPGAHSFDALAVLPFEAAPDEPDKHLVLAIRTMLFERLSAIPALPVIGAESSGAFAAHGFRVSDAPRVLHARYVLGGRVARKGNHLQLVAELFDAGSGTKLWSQDFDRSTDELSAMREAIVQRVIATLRIDGTTRSAASRAPLRFDAYELYIQANQMILDDSPLADIEKAASVYSRTTALDPAFARGYLGVGKALTFHSIFQPRINNAADVAANAIQAFDRALELDPGLGDAWADRANSVVDPGLAEQQFRKGLALAPNYTLGSIFYAWFLEGQGRVGEASVVLSRALELDPYSATLHVVAADNVMAARSDVDAALKLYRTALEIHPGYEFANDRMATLEYSARGLAAKAIRVFEQPNKNLNRPGLSWMYLDVDDPDAAQNVWWSPPEPPPHLMPGIFMYRGDTHAAAEVGRKLLATPNHPAHWLAAMAVRDEAVATGDYAGAIATLEPIYLAQRANWTRANADRSVAETYASLLIFAGRRQEGEEIARSCLSRVEADESGRPPHWLAYESAGLHAMLGEDGRALAELAAGQKLGLWSMWWYHADHNPVFAHLRKDPRFGALADVAKRWRQQQRALVDEMRRKGEIPLRGPRLKQ